MVLGGLLLEQSHQGGSGHEGDFQQDGRLSGHQPAPDPPLLAAAAPPLLAAAAPPLLATAAAPPQLTAAAAPPPKLC